MKNLLPLTFALMMLCGCAMLDVRFGNREAKRPFPATRYEWEGISYLCTEWDGGFILAIPAFVDLPISIISDTLCLPYDLTKKENTP